MRIVAALTAIVLLWSFAPVSVTAQRIAVSDHYVQRTLDRANDGIAYAFSGDAATDFILYQLSWIRSIGFVFASLVDTKLRLTEQKRDVPERTACYRIDLFLLEWKIEQVRKELKRAYEGENILAIERLRDLARFLNERHEILLRGGRDPEDEDIHWHAQRLFDPPHQGWCCKPDNPNNLCEQRTQELCEAAGGVLLSTLSECVAYGCAESPERPEEEERMCPFHSDYLPPGPEGYGCDPEAMTAALARLTDEHEAIRPSVTKEHDGLTRAVEAMEDYINQARTFLGLQREIDELLGRDSDLPAELPIREHKTITGCRDEFFGEDRTGLDAIIKWELRGPFSSEKDEGRLLNAFRELRQTEGLRRPSADYVRQAERYPLYWPFVQFAKRVLWRFSARQGEREAATFAVGSDPHSSTEEAIAPLIASVGKLSHLAQDIDGGLRGFVRDFAYYLRRSCISRPCNERLERILNIVFEDECFPFTNGRYLDEEYDYDACEQAAGIDIGL